MTVECEQNAPSFQFGFDPSQKASIYGKDYALAAMATRSVPKQHPTADAGNVSEPEENACANQRERECVCVC